MGDELLDIKAAAAWLGISPLTLRDMVTARRVPHTRIGRAVRFARHHLDAIVAAGEQQVVNPSRPRPPRPPAQPPRPRPPVTPPPVPRRPRRGLAVVAPAA